MSAGTVRMDWYDKTLSLVARHSWPRNHLVFVSAVTILAIALTDWLIEPNVSLGVLYLLPLVLLAVRVDRLPLLAVCLLCAILRQVFGPYQLDSETIPRFLLTLTAYAGISLFVNQLVRSRREVVLMLEQLRAEAAARSQSEARLQAILESTPVGVLVLDPIGRVLVANQAAKELLGLADPSQSAQQTEIGSYVPGLVNFLNLPGNPDGTLTLELPAWRSREEQFLARFWVARFSTGPERIVAVAFTDISEQVHDSALAVLENLIAGSRVVLGSVSHEIRNLAAAIGIEARNIGRSGAADVSPLLTLAAGLEKLAANQLQTVHPRFDARTDVTRVVNETAVIMAPEFVASGSALHVELPPAQLWARADYHGLLQVLLNLLNNAVRQCSTAPSDNFCRLAVTQAGPSLFIRVFNPGEPVKDPDGLFKPFSAHAAGSGLGLYVSRSIMRSFGGELRYDTNPDGPCFVLELTASPKPAVQD